MQAEVQGCFARVSERDPRQQARALSCPVLAARLQPFRWSTANAGVVGKNLVYSRRGEKRAYFRDGLVINQENRENSKAFHQQPEAGFQEERSIWIQAELPNRVEIRVQGSKALVCCQRE